MKPSTTKSTFSSIHLTLALIALAVVLGFCNLAQLFVAPRLVEERVQAFYSMIRSHEADIILNKTRSVRDELLATKAIKEDQEFSHYFSDEKAKVQSRLSNCRFVAPGICLGKTESVFLVSNSDLPPRENFKFAVVLRNDLTSPPIFLYLWEAIFALLTGLAFWLLDRTIARKEKYLLGRLAAASSAFDRARVLFGDSPSAKDEFDAFGKSAEDLVQMLENYKTKFERKTRLEQLGLTVGQVSHDLKAPLNEADNFLTSLPLLLDNASREQIEEATNSLVKRIRGGKEALNRALQQTKQITVAREELALGDVLESVKARAQQNTKLEKLSLSLFSSSYFTTLGDQIRLETAIINLLENTADEKRNAHVRLDLLAGDPGHAKILYEDNGNGIPDEYLEKIFEPLVTFKATGTGLGLSSTKEILAQHGGYIRALPHRGGAKFEIQIPVLGGGHA